MRLTILLNIFLLSMLPVALMAGNDRMVEKSGRTPDWILSAGADRFAVMAESPDLDEARDRCLDDIRQYIVNSISTNISSVEESSFMTEQTGGNENIYSSYSSELKTVAARLPFITGISLSNAEAVYWEKYKRKSDKSYYYRCHVLYPFSDLERNRMIKEFLRYDREKYAVYQNVKRKYHEITDVAEIAEGIRELESVSGYFFDNVRKKEVEALLKTYRTAYSRISLVPGQSELGTFQYSLYLENRKITCSTQPSLKSDTAVDMVVRPGGDNYILTYDYSLCYPTDYNFVLINYVFPGTVLTYRHEFDVSGKK